jgi:hypothetical protein
MFCRPGGVKPYGSLHTDWLTAVAIPTANRSRAFCVPGMDCSKRAGCLPIYPSVQN